MATNATGTTVNLGLSQWIREDDFRMEDFNSDNLAIDNAYGTLTAAISAGLKVETGTYTGTGLCGSGNKTTINTELNPLVVLVYKQDSYPLAIILKNESVAMGFHSNTYPQPINITWETGAVKLENSSASWQLNDTYTYRYIIFGT